MSTPAPALTEQAAAETRLPFTFARRHGVLVRGVQDGSPTACVVRRPRRWRSPKPGVTCACRLRLTVVEAEAFDELLRKTYEGGGESMQIGPRGHHRPGAPRPGTARAGRPARERRRCADHPPDQRGADPGDSRERLGHPHRAVREPARGALPRRRHPARGAAVQARRRAARGLAHQGHVQARHRREAPAAGRTHQPAHRRPRGRRARLDDSVRPRRARGAAPARQAGRPARPELARHGARDPAADRRADPQAARHPAGHRPDRLGQDHHAVRRARAAQRQHAATS